MIQLVFQTSHLNQGLSEASYTANATLVFVAPSDVLPRVMEKINNDIKPELLNGITDLDLGVWATPEGTMFVDGQYQLFKSECLFMIFSVLSTKDQRPNKGKDYEIAKWEEEVRKSLATKKAGPVTLTKQQEILVKQQLEKELKIRQRVREIHKHLVRGLHFIRSVIAANVEEMHGYMSQIITLLLDGALSRGSFLVGAMAFETYLVCFFSSSCILLFIHSLGPFSMYLRSIGWS